jgi:phosphoglycerate dehydrogenase-like enzyme
VPFPDQAVRAVFQPGKPSYGGRKQRGLVVSTPKEPEPVKRHRDYQHVRFENGAGRPVHPNCCGPRKIEPISVLQGKRHVTPVSLVEKRRTPLTPRPGNRKAIVAENTVAMVFALQRDTAKVTDQTRDKRSLAPAFAAKAEIRRDTRPATDALRWVENLERCLQTHLIPLLCAA